VIGRTSELDALFELYGHLRAANPLSRVDIRLAHELTSEVYSSLLVSLGGIDWNKTTRSILRDLRLPVRQVANWGQDGEDDDDVYFEVEDEDGRKAQHRPIFEKSPDGRNILLYDVALFARAVNPFNRERTVTICNGMYGRGTYGVVRTLTDPRFRVRNTQYLSERFGSSESYCVLTRVRSLTRRHSRPTGCPPTSGSSNGPHRSPLSEALLLAYANASHRAGSGPGRWSWSSCSVRPGRAISGSGSPTVSKPAFV
jgi:hypothetical protein